MELAKEIRRQFGAAAMARYVRTLPMFEPDFDTPVEMLELLKDLERVEAKARKPGKHR
jgi:hypothetical protein